MGAVMICRDEPVKTPYYIESMGIRLYSMEELAFSCTKMSIWPIVRCWGNASGNGFGRRPTIRIWRRS